MVLVGRGVEARSSVRAHALLMAFADAPRGGWAGVTRQLESALRDNWNCPPLRRDQSSSNTRDYSASGAPTASAPPSARRLVPTPLQNHCMVHDPVYRAQRRQRVHEDPVRP